MTEQPEQTVQFVDGEDAEAYTYEDDFGSLGKFVRRELTHDRHLDRQAEWEKLYTDHGIDPKTKMSEALKSLTDAAKRRAFIIATRVLEAVHLLETIVSWNSERPLTVEHVTNLPHETKKRLLAPKKDAVEDFS